MSDQPPIGNSFANVVQIVQLPPENIPLYWLQETEIVMLSKGSDTLPQQLALAFGGVALGALPGAITAIVQLNAKGQTDIASYTAFTLALASLLVAVVCSIIHRRHKTYPEELLSGILARKKGAQSSAVYSQDIA